MDKKQHAICVFCGSSSGSSAVFAEAARECGRLIAKHGYRMVFGGGGLGLMGEAARAARDAGAPVIGILPDFLRHIEPPLDSGETVEIVPDMFTRKRRMLALADAFLVLPGGIGTYDEFFEVIVARQLGQLHKPLVLLNLDHYFDPLIALLEHGASMEFLQPTLERLYRTASSPAAALSGIARLLESKPEVSRG